MKADHIAGEIPPRVSSDHPLRRARSTFFKCSRFMKRRSFSGGVSFCRFFVSTTWEGLPMRRIVFARENIVKRVSAPVTTQIGGSGVDAMPKRESIDRETRERLRLHLAAVRDEHKLNDAQLSLRLGVSRGTISSILSGGRTMGLDVFVKLHRVFGVSANFLLDSPPERKSDGDPPLSQRPALRERG
jgi:DNA-binding XRE family transcriptional regulator